MSDCHPQPSGDDGLNCERFRSLSTNKEFETHYYHPMLVQ